LRSINAAHTAELHRIAGADAPRPGGPVLDSLLDQMPPFAWNDAAAEAAMASSPWLEASSADVELRRLQGKQAKRTAHGRPEFEVTWERVPDIGALEGFDAAGLRLKVPLPLGQAGKRRRVESEAGVRRAEARTRQTRRALEARIFEAATQAGEAAASLVSLNEVEAKFAEVEFSLMQQYRLGAISYLVYLDGLRRLDEVRLQAIDVRHTELRARLELAVLSGDGNIFPLPEFDEESLR
jgi:outer membrane protein TolC